MAIAFSTTGECKIIALGSAEKMSSRPTRIIQPMMSRDSSKCFKPKFLIEANKIVAPTDDNFIMLIDESGLMKVLKVYPIA